jgi:hypothetical protein
MNINTFGTKGKSIGMLLAGLAKQEKFSIDEENVYFFELNSSIKMKDKKVRPLPVLGNEFSIHSI